VTIADARADRELDWAWLARTPGSLALTVDPSLAARAASALIDAGMAPSQPCALVSRGSTSAQRVVPGTLSTIVRDGAGAQLEAPLVLAVGESVALREHLAWLERRPLFGTRIAVTRAHAQAGELASLLRELGATVAQVPAIAVERLDDAALDAGIDSLRDAQTVVFTSRNGVDVTFARLAERGLDARAFGGVRHLACVGGSTAAALAEHGLVADIVPEAGRRTATGLLDALLELPLFGTRCTIFRAQVGDERLPDGLRRVDVDVTLVPAYRTLAEPLTAAQVDELLACDAVTFTSASTVASIVALAGDAARVPPCVTIGAPTTQAAVEAGVRVLQQAADATMPALVEAVVERALDNQGVRPWRHAAASAPQVPVSS
jgi:uroporphyrinogen III methyltransferase/synthase